MTAQTTPTLNALVEELYDAACDACCPAPRPDALNRLSHALDALERGAIVDGVWQLECVINGDLQAIAKLVKKAGNWGVK